MTGPRRRGAQAGLTLIELVAALAVFALVAVMAQQGLAALLRVREATDRQREALVDLQRAVTRIARDLESAAARTVLDADGTVRGALVIDDEGRRLEFSRGGVENPALLPRANLLRVGYRREPTEGGGGRLLRDLRPGLDRPGGPRPPETRALLEGVSDLRFRAWTAETGWVERWGEPGEGGRLGLPEGVEVRFDAAGFGRVRRVVALR